MVKVNRFNDFPLNSSYLDISLERFGCATKCCGIRSECINRRTVTRMYRNQFQMMRHGDKQFSLPLPINIDAMAEKFRALY